MDTGIIARPGEGIKGKAVEERSCGCVGHALSIRRCGEATGLWDELIGARDALSEAGHRPPKRLIDAFAKSRAAYHDHVKGEAS